MTLMFKNRISQEISRLLKIPIFILEKRVPFSYEDVVSGWGLKGARLPYYSARLYSEVKLLRQAIGEYRAERSLEIGSGYGRLTPWIAEYSNHHYAIEPELRLLNDAKKLYPEVHFYREKVQKLPFQTHYFDLCVSWTVLQHIPPKYLEKAVYEIKRVSKPKSVIILAEGIGEKKTYGYWEHSLEKWKNLFSPWELVWSKERKIELINKESKNLVMRFDHLI